MNIIDTHQHFWHYDPQRDDWITDKMSILKRNFLPDYLKTEIDGVGVQQTIAVQASQSIEETQFLLSLAEQHTFIAGVVGWVDLRAEDLPSALSEMQQDEKLKGFRHILQSDPALLEDQQFINGVSMLGQYNYTYDLLIYYHQLEASLGFAQRVSNNTPVVIDHMAKPSIRTGEFDVWAKGIREIAQLDNVFCKVSGMLTEADWYAWKETDFIRYLDLVFEVFGPSRLMYGSDWPVCLLADTYTGQFQVVNNYISRLSDTEKKLVMGETALRFYKL